VNIQSNEARCTSCHAGYGWKGKDFDFSDQTKVDCLVCHEQTGTYKKFPAGAGNPVSEPTVFPGNKKEYLPPDWNKVAQSVGRPSRQNCGVCHFFGGGGDGVKHGDLDSSLFQPNKQLDVHMGIDGQNFNCTRCHSTKLHNIAGRVYTTPASEHRRSLIEDDLASKITCESCHSSTPHNKTSKANDHTDKVACQSCHIPTFARVNPTKMWWDWSTAGKKKGGKPYVEKGELGKPKYDTKKGNFIWAKNVKPEYYWFNGSIEHLTVNDTIDPSQPVRINRPVGNKDDSNSRIFPFKIHRGKIPYDKVNKNLVIPHLFPKGKNDKAAYWKGYDWNKAIAFGMEYAGLKYSGEFDFVETEYVYPTTHMVSPKDKVVACIECHTQSDGRMAKLAGFYMPGRDSSRWINIPGWLVVIGSLIGVALHGLGRIFISKSNKEG
jgi:octaheme c-type cytochrome (tetrathionate reductase family)